MYTAFFLVFWSLVWLTITAREKIYGVWNKKTKKYFLDAYPLVYKIMIMNTIHIFFTVNFWMLHPHRWTPIL